MVPLSNIYRAGDIANNQDVGDELAHKFFLSPTHKNALDDIDITQLIMEMNFEGGSMSFIQTLAPTPPPTVSPTKSPSTSPTVSESIKTLKYLVIIIRISHTSYRPFNTHIEFTNKESYNLTNLLNIRPVNINCTNINIV